MSHAEREARALFRYRLISPRRPGAGAGGSPPVPAVLSGPAAHAPHRDPVCLLPAPPAPRPSDLPPARLRRPTLPAPGRRGDPPVHSRSAQAALLTCEAPPRSATPVCALLAAWAPPGGSTHPPRGGASAGGAVADRRHEQPGDPGSDGGGTHPPLGRRLPGAVGRRLASGGRGLAQGRGDAARRH